MVDKLKSAPLKSKSLLTSRKTAVKYDDCDKGLDERQIEWNLRNGVLKKDHYVN